MSLPVGDSQRLNYLNNPDRGVPAGDSDVRVAGVAVAVYGQSMPQGSSASRDVSSLAISMPKGDINQSNEKNSGAPSGTTD